MTESENDSSSNKKFKPNYDFEWDERRLCDRILDITCHTVKNEGSCLHEVALPPGQEYLPLVETDIEPKKYKFKLDNFQKQATLCIANDQSVMVSAHTSAGKTAVAEYAIAMCLKKKQRVIYTTPIKALSNQKYSDFSYEFKDVGLMTGDTTINKSASCLIMTTEILREMLYEGSDILNEVGWIIFDEIHYMRDKNRGYVWEETIILLSIFTRSVFLSATIPNAREFAKWICFTHDQPCNVIYTETRPTPLEHFVFPANDEQLYDIVDIHGKFLDENFNAAMATFVAKQDLSTHKKKPKEDATLDCLSMVKLVEKSNLIPAIIFSFSKEGCENFGRQTALKLSFTNKNEVSMINEVIKNALELLTRENQALNSVQKYLPYLRKGIGVHHGGLLPIIKELTEILFGEGLVKILFATETFAMGLNMPARSVVFTSLQKFDGKVFRSITPGEYIQMSGRAGRRGKDSKGTIIMRLQKGANTPMIKKLLKGKADPIHSSFHLTYNMILNNLRIEGADPEYILKKSFLQFQNYANLPDLISAIKKRNMEKKSMRIKNVVKRYYDRYEKKRILHDELAEWNMGCKELKERLVTGTLVKVRHNGVNFGWCAVMDRKVDRDNKEDSWYISVLMKVKEDPAKTEKKRHERNGHKALRDIASLTPVNLNMEGYPTISTIPLSSVLQLSTKVIKLPGILLADMKFLVEGFLLIKDYMKNSPNDIMDVSVWGDKAYSEITKKIKKIDSFLEKSTVHSAANKVQLLEKAKFRAETQLQIDILKKKLNEVRGIIQLSPLENHKTVLYKLGFLKGNDVIAEKGRLACELSAGNELLLVEMVFDGQFQELDAKECCALLSPFVCTHKSLKAPRLTPKMVAALNHLQDTARRIGKVLCSCKLNEDVDTYMDQFQPSLMEVVYYWCRGRSFDHVCKLTTIFSGDIIRTMRRLEVLVRQMVNATKVIGMEEQSQTFEEAINLLKRDIIDVDSLYMVS